MTSSDVAKRGNESFKAMVLVVLVLQNSALALFMKHSRKRVDDAPLYAATTAVVCAELVKVVVSLVLQAKEDGGVSGLLITINRDIVTQPFEMLKMFVPAGLYCLQNNLAYVAMNNLEAPTFQLLYQLKILTTAMFSVIMLRRTLSVNQWISLLLLTLGVALVQLNSAKPADGAGNSVIGLLAVLSACVTSGFAGVYFEKVLKTSQVSLWIRNIQLAGYGLIIGLLYVYMGPDAKLVATNGFLGGYNWVVWAAVLLNSLGGLVVAMVVKYADNLVKNFATSISILMTCVVSYFLFSFTINAQFLIGGAIVLYSIYLYSDVRSKAVMAAGTATGSSSKHQRVKSAFTDAEKQSTPISDQASAGSPRRSAR